jgi:hypothetical protein
VTHSLRPTALAHLPATPKKQAASILGNHKKKMSPSAGVEPKGAILRLAGATRSMYPGTAFAECSMAAAPPTCGAPCPHTCEIYFPSAPRLLFLEFRNFYSASASVEVAYDPEATADVGNVAADGGTTSTGAQAEVAWCPLVPKVSLMKDPHCETDAQRWHRLRLTRNGRPTQPVRALRITLQQPSPLWEVCRLDELCCVRQALFSEQVKGSTAASDTSGSSPLPTWPGMGMVGSDTAGDEVMVGVMVSETIPSKPRTLPHSDSKGGEGAAGGLESGGS